MMIWGGVGGGRRSAHSIHLACMCGVQQPHAWEHVRNAHHHGSEPSAAQMAAYLRAVCYPATRSSAHLAAAGFLQVRVDGAAAVVPATGWWRQSCKQGWVAAPAHPAVHWPSVIASWWSKRLGQAGKGQLPNQHQAPQSHAFGLLTRPARWSRRRPGTHRGPLGPRAAACPGCLMG